MAGTGGAIVVLLKVILPMFGINIPDDGIAAFVGAIATIGATVMLVWGQVRRPDLVGGLIRKG